MERLPSDDLGIGTEILGGQMNALEKTDTVIRVYMYNCILISSVSVFILVLLSLEIEVFVFVFFSS